MTLNSTGSTETSGGMGIDQEKKTLALKTTGLRKELTNPPRNRGLSSRMTLGSDLQAEQTEN